jgi:hypothetical protein
MSFSMGRLYQRITTAKPSTLVFSAVVVGFAIFLFGGGLYDIIMAPYPAVYYQNQFLIVYPGLSEQFIGDSLVAMILYGLGVFGLIIMYQSTKYAYKPRQAYMMFFGGTILLFIAYIVLEATIRLKSG